MNFVMAAATVFQLVLMPTAGLPGIRTAANAELFKPFSVQKTFSTENECHADFESNAGMYLQQRGLPFGTSANHSCSAVQQ